MSNLDVLISPSYRLSSFGGNPSLDDKLLVFEDRVKGWFLNVAEEMLANNSATQEVPKCYFAVLATLAVYFEMIGQYVTGQPSQSASRVRFCQGVELVYPGDYSEHQRRQLYSSLRCALYHNGLTRGAVVGQRHSVPFHFGEGLVWINPILLLEGIKKHFANYLRELRDPIRIEERLRFEKMYDLNPKL